MRAATDSLVVPQIIDFLKIATRKPTRAFMEGMVRAARLPESVLALTDAEFEPTSRDTFPIRGSGAIPATATARPSRTWT